MINPDDLKCLFDIAVNSMDFGSGFLDHEEVLVLRRVAKVIGVNEMEATPSNFKASFAHDFTAPKERRYWPSRETYQACGICGRLESFLVHHGVSVTEPTSPYEAST